ncbi:MAG: RNA polymerase sigma factor [bacterium]
MGEEKRQLVARIQAGDTAAEHELFVKYKDTIFWKICRGLNCDIENIHDIAADAYLAILQGLRKRSFNPENWPSLEAFVWGVVNNKIRDWLKRSKKETRYFVNEPVSDDMASASEEYLLENKELRNILRTLLKNLDEKYKEALELRYFQELSVQEISKKIGIAPRRVSERLNYALKLMRNACRKSKFFSIFGLFVLLLECYE